MCPPGWGCPSCPRSYCPLHGAHRVLCLHTDRQQPLTRHTCLTIRVKVAKEWENVQVILKFRSLHLSCGAAGIPAGRPIWASRWCTSPGSTAAGWRACRSQGGSPRLLAWRFQMPGISGGSPLWLLILISHSKTKPRQEEQSHIFIFLEVTPWTISNYKMKLN